MPRLAEHRWDGNSVGNCHFKAKLLNLGFPLSSWTEGDPQTQPSQSVKRCSTERLGLGLIAGGTNLVQTTQWCNSSTLKWCKAPSGAKQLHNTPGPNRQKDPYHDELGRYWCFVFHAKPNNHKCASILTKED